MDILMDPALIQYLAIKVSVCLRCSLLAAALYICIPQWQPWHLSLPKPLERDLASPVALLPNAWHQKTQKRSRMYLMIHVMFMGMFMRISITVCQSSKWKHNTIIRELPSLYHCHLQYLVNASPQSRKAADAPSQSTSEFQPRVVEELEIPLKHSRIWRRPKQPPSFFGGSANHHQSMFFTEFGCDQWKKDENNAATWFQVHSNKEGSYSTLIYFDSAKWFKWQTQADINKCNCLLPIQLWN